MFDKDDTHPILQFFKYEHLPTSLQRLSRPFAELAYHIRRVTPINPEQTVALRKLLEAKDCAVRAALMVLPAIQPASSQSPPQSRPLWDVTQVNEPSAQTSHPVSKIPLI